MLREPAETDWPAILDLANRSVAHVSGAGAQDEWLANRRNRRRGQRQFVLEEEGELMGYGAIEASDDVRGGYRVFIVTTPERRVDAGELLFAHARACLDAEGAAQSWFIEYAEDTPFLRFIEKHGYSEARRFDLPTGLQAVVLSQSHTRSQS